MKFHTLLLVAYKIASYELVDISLIEYVASKGKPMIISVGMGSLEEIQDAIDACHRMNNDQIVLLKCCSEYPAPWNDMKLGNIPDMIERYKVPIGLSDHSAGSIGACVIEKHVKLDGVEGADSGFSMTMDDFAQMVQDVHNAKMIAKGPDYSLTKGEESSTVFRRSIFTIKDIKAGEKFSKENIRVIRPGYGMKPKYYNETLGKKASCDIQRGMPMKEEYVND